ncbi:hypothetical protein AAG584_19095 [Vreelandella titanicae]|uniref:Mu-like prophage FluMu N-terminal domain-containing protein n=1 Tax=Vreelandella titanicae TaxID=664683 RepID=A0AAP9NN09_9GAMM|nr:hypothetical protein [Halomonas titanicae]QKS24791.1 hypothetical protein FX987_02573 [Halomonas titanicae]
MATRKTTATKAKQAPAKAEATEPKAEPETPADAVAPNAEQEAQADAKATEPTPEKVTEPPTPADAVAPDAEQISTDSTPTEIQAETITGDGTGNALPPMEETPGVFVRTKRRIKSRRRAGHRFNREGTFIALEELSEEQLEQLNEDPALEVKDSIQLEATSEPET